MDVREKLVEILTNAGMGKYETQYIADALIANGVTVQEWKPISELTKENCVDRIITRKTNADRIRSMSIDELNDFLGKVADHDDDCPYEYGSVKSSEWLGKPYVQKEYKKI